MHLDFVSDALRRGEVVGLLTHAFRWHNTDGKGRRGIGAVLSSFFLWQKAQEIVRGTRVTPYVSLSLAGFCWALFFFPEHVTRLFPLLSSLHPAAAGIIPATIIANPMGEWARLFIAALPHDSNPHVFYNLLSLLWRGHAMENRFGSLYALFLFLFLQLTTSLLHVWISWKWMWEYSFCSFGLNALLMALKVVMNQDPEQGETIHLFGFTLNGRWIPWLELGLLYLLFPHLSIVAHIAGVIAGFLFVYLVNPFRVPLGDSPIARALRRVQGWLQVLTPKMLLSRVAPVGVEQEDLAQHAQMEDVQQEAQQIQGEGRIFQSSPAYQGLSLNGDQLAGLPAQSGAEMDSIRAAVTTLMNDLTSQNLSAGEVVNVLSVLHRALKHIVSSPNDEKYRRLNTVKLAAKLGAGTEASVTLLKTLLSQAEAEEQNEEQLLVFEAPDVDQLDKLDAACSLLQNYMEKQAAQNFNAKYYTRQMEELFNMGYRDRRLNFATLKQTNGDVQAAIKKLPRLSKRPNPKSLQSSSSSSSSSF